MIGVCFRCRPIFLYGRGCLSWWDQTRSNRPVRIALTKGFLTECSKHNSRWQQEVNATCNSTSYWHKYACMSICTDAHAHMCVFKHAHTCACARTRVHATQCITPILPIPICHKMPATLEYSKNSHIHAWGEKPPGMLNWAYLTSKKCQNTRIVCLMAYVDLWMPKYSL